MRARFAGVPGHSFAQDEAAPRFEGYAMDWLRNSACTLIVCACLALSACNDDSDSPPAVPSAHAVTVLQTKGTQWIRPDGTQVVLNGVNLGNWLLNEFWMMGQTHVADQCTLEATLTRRFGAQANE